MRVAGVLSALLLGTAIVIVQPVATALTPSEIANIARQITVRIDGASTGSGVIIERQSNVYTVVTNWHVVQLKGNYTVHTPDGKKYTFNHSQVKQFRGVDLAVFQFTSNENYRVAEKGNSDQIQLGTNISVAGYPQDTPDIRFLRGEISTLVTKPKDGYAFVYDIGGFPGMSGGAILDEQGKLVGIHGRATTRPDTNATTVLGIPLKTYLSLASSVQPVATAPASKPPVSNVQTPKPQNPPRANVPSVTTSPPVNINNISKKYALAMTLKGHSDLIKSIKFSPDNKTFASGSYDSSIKIWDLKTGKEILTLQGHSNSVTSVTFSPDGKTLASSSGDKSIKIWNLATRKIVTTLEGHSDWVYSVVFSPDGKTLASGSRDGTIRIWSLTTGEVLDLYKSGAVHSVDFSPDGKVLASGLDLGFQIWNLTTKKPFEAKNPFDLYSMDFVIAFSPDGKILAGRNGESITIWNISTGQVITTLKGHSDSVFSVAFSPDGKTLASGSRDQNIKIWNLATGTEVITLKGHSSTVMSVAFSPDGKTLASGGRDQTIKIWRLSE